MDIYSIPDFILARGIAAGGVLFSILGCLLIGRRWNRFFGLSSETNGIVSSFLSVTGVFFGILFGLVIVSAWETYDKVGEIEQAEASALRQLYLAADAQGDAATELKTLERDYARVVLQREWPAQKAAKLETVEYREGYMLLRRIRIQITSITALAPERSSELLKPYQDLVEARDARISSIGAGIPKNLWTGILVLTVVNMLLLWLLVIDSLLLDVLLNGVVGMAIAVVVAFSVVVDHPFRGETSVAPTHIEEVYQYEMR